MTKTIWGRQRKAATEAGAYHAQGGDDRRHEFASRGVDVGLAYQQGYENERRRMEEQAERENHPLRRISREANALWNRAESSDVSELARLVEELADYILEKEES